MTRGLSLLALSLVAGGCRTYQRYDRITDADGLVPADVFARYGTEQAQAVAIGRALATGYTGPGAADLARQVQQAAEYARSLPQVVGVRADTLGFLLTVRFASGWEKAITPIDDGVPADQTPGLPARR